MDVIDRRVAYHLYQSHPGDSLSYTTPGTSYSTVRVPAESVAHLFFETRPGQVRGVPWMHSIIQAVWDHYGYTEAERVRAKGAASLMAFVEGGDPEEGTPRDVDGGGPATDETGNLVTNGTGDPMERWMPMGVAYLPPGKTIKFNQPGVPPHDSWLRVSLLEIASGAGISYESLTGDFSHGNFSFSKLGQTEQYRLFRSLREQVVAPFALDPVWQWFCDAAIGAGLLPDDGALYDVKWSSPRLESADRYNDAKADELEMRIGTGSRREILAGYGLDPDDVDADIALDNANRDKLGVVLDSDPRQTSLSGRVQPDASAA